MDLTAEKKPLVRTFRSHRVREHALTGPESPRALGRERPRVRGPASRLFLRLAAVLLVAGLGFLAAAPAHAQQEGDVKIVKDSDNMDRKGRVEIYHEGVWGGVCDDSRPSDGTTAWDGGWRASGPVRGLWSSCWRRAGTKAPTTLPLPSTGSGSD